MPTDTNASGRLYPPENGGATIRMYRIGHGDCFLIAFPGKDENTPVYVLIDCGYKPGSQAKLNTKTSAAEIAADIAIATGNVLDLVILTHEHQDHLNGITEKNFGNFEIRTLWLAWTEDPADPLANELRAKHKDVIRGLSSAARGLAMLGLGPQASSVEEFLEMELGEPSAPFVAPNGRFGAKGDDKGDKKPKDPQNSDNKIAMDVFKTRAKQICFLHPHEPVRNVPNTNVRAFVLGPPRDKDKIHDTEPDEGSAFEKEEKHQAKSAAAFFAAAAVGSGASSGSPFDAVYSVPRRAAFSSSQCDGFFASVYGDPESDSKAAKDLAWRRIESDWLVSAGQLALAMNNDTNNSSLVLAFEIPPHEEAEKNSTGKILLFAGDAQAGNWLSWADKGWTVGKREIKAEELLANTVVYKTGHHGSHNATLKGQAESAYPNLSWMGQGARAAEFTALITAVRKWAITKPDGKWDHPLPSIKAALLKKAQGRVLQTDTEIANMQQEGGTAGQWKDFTNRLGGANPLYFDLQIHP